MNQAQAAIKVIQVVAEAIRELGSVPSGHLYAQVMGQLSLDEFNKVVGVLKSTGLVSESGHELKWVGPEI